MPESGDCACHFDPTSLGLTPVHPGETLLLIYVPPYPSVNLEVAPARPPDAFSLPVCQPPSGFGPSGAFTSVRDLAFGFLPDGLASSNVVEEPTIGNTDLINPESLPGIDAPSSDGSPVPRMSYPESPFFNAASGPSQTPLLQVIMPPRRSSWLLLPPFRSILTADTKGIVPHQAGSEPLAFRGFLPTIILDSQGNSQGSSGSSLCRGNAHMYPVSFLLHRQAVGC